MCVGGGGRNTNLERCMLNLTIYMVEFRICIRAIHAGASHHNRSRGSQSAQKKMVPFFNFNNGPLVSQPPDGQASCWPGASGTGVFAQSLIQIDNRFPHPTVWQKEQSTSDAKIPDVNHGRRCVSVVCMSFVMSHKVPLQATASVEKI